MHVEPPEHGPRSLKEFLGQYLMIVLGILTALGLEQVIESAHHHSIATQAQQQIEEELRSNLEQVNQTVEQNKQRLSVLKAAQDTLLQQALKKQMSAESVSAQFKTIPIGALTPTLRRDAWDAAIANQALSHVDPAAVRRYSEGYSAQREESQTILATFTIGDWPGQLTGAMVDARLGRVEPASLLKALASYEMALSAIAGNERELQTALSSALKADSKPSAH